MLREVAGAVDFDFVYGEVRDFYGSSGNVSLPPLYIEHAVFIRAIWA